MTWRYGIGKKTDHDEVYFHVIEVYCDEEHKPWGWMHAKPDYAESQAEALGTLQMMLNDCGKYPVLDLDAPMPGKGPEADDEV